MLDVLYAYLPIVSSFDVARFVVPIGDWVIDRACVSAVLFAIVQLSHVLGFEIIADRLGDSGR